MILGQGWALNLAQPKRMYLDHSQVKCLKSLAYPFLLPIDFLLYLSQLALGLFPIFRGIKCRTMQLEGTVGTS